MAGTPQLPRPWPRTGPFPLERQLPTGRFRELRHLLQQKAHRSKVLRSRDDVGHGTHKASTVAGRHVRNASFPGFAQGVSSGIAPNSRIAVYRVCGIRCAQSDILAGMGQAIQGGVDVISLSLGDAIASPYDEDPIPGHRLICCKRERHCLFGCRRKLGPRCRERTYVTLHHGSPPSVQARLTGNFQPIYCLEMAASLLDLHSTVALGRRTHRYRWFTRMNYVTETTNTFAHFCFVLFCMLCFRFSCANFSDSEDLIPNYSN